MFLVLVLAVRAAAQTTSISGTTLDDRTGEPLPGVLVYIENQPVFAETDADGRFTLPVPPGIYTIAASLIGYAIARVNVIVRGAESPPIVLRLAGMECGSADHVCEVAVAGRLVAEPRRERPLDRVAERRGGHALFRRWREAVAPPDPEGVGAAAVGHCRHRCGHLGHEPRPAGSGSVGVVEKLSAGRVLGRSLT